MRVPKFEECTPNPHCRCGCGMEVSMPWQSHVAGHKSSSMSKEDKDKIKELKSNGVPASEVALIFGVSPKDIFYIRPSKFLIVRRPVIRKEEIEFRKKLLSCKQLIWKIRKRA